MAGADSPPPLTRSEGPLLIGSLVGASLTGLLANQIFLYYTRSSKKDRWLFQWAVGLLGFLALLGYCATARNVWLDFILEAPNSPDVSRPLRVFCPMVSSLVADVFFSARCVLLSTRKALVGAVLGVLVAAETAVFFVAFVLAVADQGLHDSHIPARVATWKAAALSIAAGTNMVVTGTLLVLIAPRRSGFNDGTDKLIHRLFTLSITSSALNTLVYIGTAATLLAQIKIPSLGTLSNVFTSCLPQVTALCVVGTLNLRPALRDTGAQTFPGGGTGGSARAGARRTRPSAPVDGKRSEPFRFSQFSALASPKPTAPHLGVEVRTTTTTEHEIALADCVTPTSDLEGQLSSGSDSGAKRARPWEKAEHA